MDAAVHQRDDLCPNSYLEWLLEDIHLAVLRKLSARPRLSNWHAYLNPPDVLALLRHGGPMAACLRKEIAVVGLGSHTHSLLAVGNSDLFVNTNVRSGQELFVALVAEMRNSLQKLSLCYSSPQWSTWLFENFLSESSVLIREIWVW